MQTYKIIPQFRDNCVIQAQEEWLTDYTVGDTIFLISNLPTKKFSVISKIEALETGEKPLIFIDQRNLENNLQLLVLIFLWVFSSIVNLIVLILLRSEKKELTFEDEMTIKKIVLDLGMKYTRLEVREISEKCGCDSDSIIEVLNSMIVNKEIYAEFFKSSNTVSFDQQANIDEIDELMVAYKDWEDEHIGKNL